ncbi:hypothetical protein BGX30_013728 [Mortierella sp. GBA39]|nr:hypothetical protein BGX30_013728 [Mortierella sp. GBA39]
MKVSNAFSVKATPTETIDDLRVLISARLEIDTLSKDITLWRVFLPIIPANKHTPIILREIDSSTELDPTEDVSDVFEKPPKKTIHIIFQRPPPGDLHADIKRITDKFFAPGSDIVKFLNAFVRDKVTLPVTTGPIQGLPRAWRRGFGIASEKI